MASRIKVEKKLAGPQSLPGFETACHPDPKRAQAKVLPWWLVFSREVKPGETSLIMASSQLPFKGYRLAVDPTIAPNFRILDLRVGRNSYCINGHEGAAATLFPPLPDKLTPQEREDYEELLKMRLDTADIGMTVGLNVVNHSRLAIQFSAILWGFAAE